MSSSIRLSCLRCKQKKLRCDKQEPCSRCRDAGASCTSVQRKSRAAQSLKNKEIATSLNTRINILEQALQHALQQPDTPDHTQHATQAHSVSSSTIDSIPHHHQSEAPTVRQGSCGNTSLDTTEKDTSWIDRFRDVRAVMNTSINNLNGSEQSTPNPGLSDAINVLDGAIADLNDFTDVANDGNTSNVLSKAEAREAIQVALELTGGEMFTFLLDHDFMLSLSDVVTSPHVQVDPAAQMVYHCLVFHGHIMCQYKSPTAARRLYLRCLQIVPVWQSAATRTKMDLVAASILSWTCVVSSDSRLGWTFHRKACEYVRQLGMVQLDLFSTHGTRESDLKDDERRGFWQLVLADIMYRLCDGKPSCISNNASLKYVRMPDYPDPSRPQPPAVLTITSILWGRIIFILKEYLEYRDGKDDAAATSHSEEDLAKLEQCVEQIESLIDDWNVVNLIRSTGTKTAQTLAYAEVTLNAYNCIGHLERLRTGGSYGAITERALSASRVIIDLVAEVHEMSAGTRYSASYQYSIAFYPFHACFVLYYHILGSSTPDDYKEDTNRLEKLGAMMSQVSQSRFEYIPIAKAITSLNHITRYVKLAKTSDEETTLWTTAPDGQATTMQPAMTGSQGLQDGLIQKPTLNDPLYDVDTANFVHMLPPFEGERMYSAADFQNILSDANFDPLSYMQEVEQQFLDRHAGQGSLWQQSGSFMYG